MLHNFFKTAFRSLWKKKSFSFLNIMGLAVGIAASLLIFLVIRNELSFDRYHKNAGSIYRVVSTKTNRSNGEIKEHVTGVPWPLPETLAQDFDQLVTVAAIDNLGEAQVYVPGKDLSNEKRFKENEGLFWVQPTVFEMFDYTWLAGNATGLKDPNTAVLTQSLADKFFGGYANAIGKTVQIWSYRIPLRIVGVYKDLPANTDLPMRLGASYFTLHSVAPGMFTDRDAWQHSNAGLHCFVQVKEQSLKRLQAQLPAFVKKYNMDGDEKMQTLTSLVLQPLTKIHLDKDYYTIRGDRLAVRELWSLALIGIFLLLVACINFINLSTAQSVTRAKEIGVRKVLGSNRSQLMKQFLQETALITTLAILLGCLMAWLALPLLNNLLHKGLSLDLLQYPVILLFLVITGIVVTFLAGFYPGMVLSGFNPVMIFKNKISTKMVGGISLRRGLVVFQFVIAQLLVIGTIVVVKQMEYFRNQPMGFEKDGIMLINLPSDSSLKVKYPLLESRMLQVPGVTAASLCMDAPSNFWTWNTPVYFNNNPEKQGFDITRHLADTGFYKTFGITLVAGRLPFHSDTVRELVVNETTVKKLGLSSANDIIGKTLSFDGNQQFPVVGVVKDFNSRSLHLPVSPAVISPSYEAYNWIAVRLNRTNMNTTLDQVQKLFTSIYPTYMYDRYFFDERIERFYESEAITARLFKIFAFLAIFISCLGLYGLVSFMAVQKTKEVGIRKVLGASVQNIVYLFSKEFTILIGIAFVIAAPAGYYFMQGWLSDFYYHTDMGWSVFAIAIIASLIIAWITVGYKAIRAALANPVKSLKTE